MPYYQDANLAMTVIVTNEIQDTHCQGLAPNFIGSYPLLCKKTLTATEKDRIAIEIVGTAVSQFNRLQKNFLNPLGLSYPELPLYVDISTAYQCHNNFPASFKASKSPQIRLCTLDIARGIRHETTHWLLWALTGSLPEYKMVSEGCANYFQDGVCGYTIRTYADLTSKNIPKISTLLLPNYQTPDYNSYILGSLLCATFHQHANKEDLLTLLAETHHPDTPKKIQFFYQTHFETFIRNLNYFCQQYPEGIYPRTKITETVVTRMTREVPQLAAQPISSFTTHLTVQGLIGVVNGTTYFLLEKVTQKLQKNYPWLEKSIRYLAQPILSSAIHSAQIENLENNAILFGLNCISGIAIQLLIKYISYGLGERTSNTLLNSIFFLHTMAIVIRSDNPAETIIEQLLSTAAAMLSYLLASLIASRCIHSENDSAKSQVPRNHQHNTDQTKPFLTYNPSNFFSNKKTEILSKPTNCATFRNLH